MSNQPTKQQLRKYLKDITGTIGWKKSGLYNVKTEDEFFELLKRDKERDERNVKEEKKTKLKIKKQDDKVQKLNIVFNNGIANTPFINTTMSDQISIKFSLGEYSIKTKHQDFIGVEINNTFFPLTSTVALNTSSHNSGLLNAISSIIR